MTTVNAVRDRILTLCGERNISINKLATLCALPPSSVKNILYGKSQNPKLLTVKMICDGLDMTLAEFFDTETFNTLEPEIKQPAKNRKNARFSFQIGKNMLYCTRKYCAAAHR